MASSDCDATETMDLVDILRQFILTAPPGELTSVLQSLRALTGEDRLFLEATPRLCIEHHLRHLTPFMLDAVYARRDESKVRDVGPNSLPTSSSTGTEDVSDAVVEGKVSFLAGRPNHLFTQIKRFAQLNHIPLREVMQSVEEYFYHQRAALVRGTAESHTRSNIDTFLETEMDIATESEDFFADIVPQYGFSELKHVFFDLALQLYVEIDPLEQVCRCVIPFPSVTLPTTPEVLREIEHQVEGLHDGPLAHVGLLLRQEVARYVQLCFGTAEATAHAETPCDVGEKCGTSQLMRSVKMLLNSNDSDGVSGSSSTRRDASRCYGSFVSLQRQRSGNMRGTAKTSSEKSESKKRDEAPQRSLVIGMSALRYFPRNMWSGRWKSIFVVECVRNASGEAYVSIRGETQVYAHYYEEGNTHLEITRGLDPTPLPQWPTAILTSVTSPLLDGAGNGIEAWELASVVMTVIRQHGERVEGAVLRAAREVDGLVLHNLRRRRPITRRPFNVRRTRAPPPSIVLTDTAYRDEDKRGVGDETALK